MRILIKWIVKSGRPMTTLMYAKNVWKENSEPVLTPDSYDSLFIL